VLKDPLTHLIRNAIDHGIEDPETRLSRGKLPEGRIVLKAFHEGGHVIMEIQDDGGGIHLGRIRRKAVEGGYLSLDQATQAKEMDLINLIFMPGFSTREQATDLSGRGVGMDVVKTNIEKMGGTIEVFNKEGYGVRFRIRIPLTLAIVQALIVACGGRRYAVPQINLVEVLRVSTRAIESVHGAPVFRLRGQLLPIVHLHDALQVESGRNGSGSVDVVVLQADERRFGLAVDHVENTLEIVVKSLNRPLGRVPCFTAATILGDGEVVLILDVHGLAARSNVLAPAKDRVFLESETPSERPAGVPTLLLCQVRDDGRVAIPLSRVVRLEEFPRTRLERMGVHHVVQYRGHILPVAHVSSLLPERRQKPRQSETAAGVVRVVVIRTDDGRAIGLGVEKILDAVEQPGPLQRPSGRPGTLGCIVLQGRVTEVLDLARLTQLIDEAFAGVVKTP
jgi:two-component system chemotaxis sensor kinase CheA